MTTTTGSEVGPYQWWWMRVEDKGIKFVVRINLSTFSIESSSLLVFVLLVYGYLIQFNHPLFIGH